MVDSREEGAEKESSQVCPAPPVEMKNDNAEGNQNFSFMNEKKEAAEAEAAVLESQDEKKQEEDEEEDGKYKYMILDSGPIIRMELGSGHTNTNNSNMIHPNLHREAAHEFVTVEGVLDEIRDAKARHHLDQWASVYGIELKTRQPSPHALAIVSDFARKTGDYRNLSSVDLALLALAYDLEMEGCEGNMSHVRTQPKHMLGIGRVQYLNNNNNKNEVSGETQQQQQLQPQMDSDGSSLQPRGEEFFAGTRNNLNHSSTMTSILANTTSSTSSTTNPPPPQIKSWAMMVDPNISPVTPDVPQSKLLFRSPSFNDDDGSSTGGQFSDADEDDNVVNNPDDKYLIQQFQQTVKLPHSNSQEEKEEEQEGIWEDEFPTLSSSAIPSSANKNNTNEDDAKMPTKWQDQHDEIKQQSLRPITNQSQKLYNSFRRYQHVVTPSGVSISNSSKDNDNKEDDEEKNEDECMETKSQETKITMTEVLDNTKSRIMGVSSGQSTHIVNANDDNDDDEDDGEGWVTCSRDLKSMKARGILHPTSKPTSSSSSSSSLNDNSSNKTRHRNPPNHKRAACATTDFAMQNVLLQMNLVVCSTSEMKISRLKSWVTRCGACFTVYTGEDNRLFCDKCGSDFLQRISASVDGKTGRLRLHLSKRYKNNLRGTKYSLPKPGMGNKYQGDLLLREDQLLYGAWNQKVKRGSGSRAREEATRSIFGSDLASHVGCQFTSTTDLTKRSDIKIGLGSNGGGRRGGMNPNATKFGRERRGKKKKNVDKACGVKRY